MEQNYNKFTNTRYKPHLENKTTMEIAQIAPQLQLLSIQDVCNRLGIGYWLVYKLINENKLRSITIGKRRLIPVQALQDFITNAEAEGYNNG